MTGRRRPTAAVTGRGSATGAAPPILLGVGTVVALALLLAVIYGARKPVPAEAAREAPTREPVTALEVVFLELPDGTLEVRSPESRALLRTLPPGEGGFMRGVMRPLRRERTRLDRGVDEPYRLTRWSDGSLTLSDVGGGLQLELAAFGATSVAAFAALLASNEPSHTRR